MAHRGGSRLRRRGPAPGAKATERTPHPRRELSRGLELCKRAQHTDPRNAYIYWCLAQLHLLTPSRKDAIDAVERGLRAAPDNFMLLRMRKRLGVRQPPPLPFLDRNHGLNVKLGRLMHRIKGHTPAMLPA